MYSQLRLLFHVNLLKDLTRLIMMIIIALIIMIIIEKIMVLLKFMHRKLLILVVVLAISKTFESLYTLGELHNHDVLKL